MGYINYDYEGKQKFKIEHDLLCWEAQIEIDFDFPDVMKEIKEMVEFWSNWEDRLEDNGDDYVETFLKQLGLKLLGMRNEYGSLQNVIEQFNWDGVHGEEGYCPMDGSKGIKIIDLDRLEFDYDDFDISSIDKE
jgi:hypothetical protein